MFNFEPGGGYNVDDIPDLAAILAIVNVEARELAEKEYKKTFATWSEKPGLRVVPNGSDGFDMELTGEKGIHWGYIDEGTQSRDILPRNPAGLLKFRSGYSPKTQSGFVGSAGGGDFGGYVSKKSVHGHSIKARKWTPEIERTVNQFMEQRFVDLVNQPGRVRGLAGRVGGFFRRILGR